MDERRIVRYADASPALLYCADILAEAFPDAKIVQIVRDGRDVVSAMLADAEELAWFRRGVENVDSEFPNPFFGVETPADLTAWRGLTLTGKCAMRWRGSVRKMARLRTSLDGDRLTTFRYEDVIGDPATAAAQLSDFVGARVAALELPGPDPAQGWRHALTPDQIAEIDRVAGEELRRIGYGG